MLSHGANHTFRDSLRAGISAGANLGAQEKAGGMRGLRVAPATQQQGMRNQQASHINKAQTPGQGMAAFSSVRTEPYALPSRVSRATPQAIHQMMQALLLRTQMR